MKLHGRSGRCRRQPAFTLIELLVIVAIIALIAQRAVTAVWSRKPALKACRPRQMRHGPTNYTAKVSETQPTTFSCGSLPVPISSRTMIRTIVAMVSAETEEWEME